MSLTLIAQVAMGQSTRIATLAWDASVEPDLAGYRLYYGEASRAYTSVIELPVIALPAGPQATVPGLLRSKTYYFAVTAFNTAGLESDFSNEAVLPAANAPPTMNEILTTSLVEDTGITAIELSGISAGPGENQPISIFALSSNPQLIANPTVVYSSPGVNGYLFLRPVPNGHGTAVITVILDDGQKENNIFARSFLVAVEPINDPPTIGFIPTVTIAEDTSITIALSVQDVDTPAEHLQIAASGSNPSLFGPGGIQVVGSGSQSSLVLQPLPNQFGTATIMVTARDGQGALHRRSFALEVTPVNDPPTLNALGNISMVANFAAFPVALLNVGPGATNENQTVTVTAVSSAPSVVPHPTVSYLPGASSGMLMITPALNSIGDATITVTIAETGGGLSLSRTFDVSVFDVFQLLPNVPTEITISENTVEIPFLAYEGHSDAAVVLTFANSLNPFLVPPWGLRVEGNGARRRLVIVPVPGRSGVALVELTALLGSTSVTRYVQVNVLPTQTVALPLRYEDWIP